jgi:hypothetical protein
MWTYGLLALAGVLMFPALYSSGLSRATSEDWDVASTPVARIPLDSLQRTRSASLVFAVPATDAWTRIRETWGDPGYVVCVRSPAAPPSILPWSTLGLQISATTGRGTLDMAAAGSIQDSNRSTDTGLVFRPKPGERVRLEVAVGGSVTLPDGELTVAPHWDSNGEARAWGMALALNFRPYLRLAFILGFGLLLAATVIGNWRAA